MSGELTRLRRDTVELAQDGMREAFPNGPPGDLGSKFYLYLLDLWFSTHENYFRNTRRGKSGERHQLTQNVIMDQIEEPNGKFEMACAGKKRSIPYLDARVIKQEEMTI